MYKNLCKKINRIFSVFIHIASIKILILYEIPIPTFQHYFQTFRFLFSFNTFKSIFKFISLHSFRVSIFHVSFAYVCFHCFQNVWCWSSKHLHKLFGSSFLGYIIIPYLPFHQMNLRRSFQHFKFSKYFRKKTLDFENKWLHFRRFNFVRIMFVCCEII